ncbi:MAG: hypothetical protein IT249_12090 [Chitinophagaceae bacterium]|nr:hypothetical protein [Chitinophagaceae bacterium]
MKSFVLFAVVFVLSASVKAQIALPGSFIGYQNPYSLSHRFLNTDTDPNKKWFLSRYTAISAGYSFFKGGSFNYISAPVGLQLNRRLNNNLYAFAGLSVTPTYINFNQPVPLSGMNKMYNSSIFGANNFAIYPRAEMGLMYINDDKTFSISGSISVQRGGYYLPAQSVTGEHFNQRMSHSN